jgi:hypothetical protein
VTTLGSCHWNGACWYPACVADLSLPGHVVTTRRDGRREILLHRSVALLSDDRVEIKAARSTIYLPLAILLICAGLIAWVALTDSAPLWALVVVLLFSLVAVPGSVMGLIGALAGAEVIVDGRKGSATWQQGYLGMGIGTRELVPFAKIDHLEVAVEGDEPDRWQQQRDDLRQFALVLVKQSGKRLTLTQVPVPEYGQADGMDRTLAVGHAVAAITGAEVRIPEGWEMVEVDAETLAPVERPAPPEPPSPTGKRRQRR